MAAPAALIVSLVALAACGATPRPVIPSSDGHLPGMLWITPAQRWRMPGYIASIHVEGERAITTDYDGWMFELDLANGRVLREARVLPSSIDRLVRLPGDRWLAVGTGDRHAIAAEVDAAWRARPIVLPVVPTKDFSPADAAVVRDGVVISGRGLPLALYDARTWEETKVLDEALDFSTLHASGSVLYAWSPTRGGNRFDLETGSRTKLFGMSLASNAQGILVRSHVHERVKTVIERSQLRPIELPDLALSVVLDPAGRWLAESMQLQHIRVRSLPDGKVVRTLSIGRHGALAFAGDRLLVGQGSGLRVVDLRTGAVSGAGPAPNGALKLVSVSDAGDVIVTGDATWRVRAGEVAATTALEPLHWISVMPGEVQRTGYHTSMLTPDTTTPRVVVRPLGGGADRAWLPGKKIESAWLGHNGEVVLELKGKLYRPQLAYSRGSELVKLDEMAQGYSLEDVDVDAKLALVERDGTAFVIDLQLGAVVATVRYPACSVIGQAALERGGSRIVTLNDRDVVLWDRKRGVAIATLRHASRLRAAAFMPGGDELLLHGDHGLVLWSPSRGSVHSIAVARLASFAISERGTRIAVELGDGRISLLDAAVLRAAMQRSRYAEAPIPTGCTAPAPFEVAPGDPDG